MKSMKKVCALFVVLALLLPLTMSVVAEETTDPNVDILAQEERIDALLSERERILAEDPVNVMELNAVESELMDLGVTFLTDTEVAEQFPDAYASVQGTDINETDENGITPRIDAPPNRSNLWTLRTFNGYEYMGEYYVVQKLTAEPLVPANSSLWNDDSATVNYNYNWVAGVTTLLQCAAECTISAFAPISYTVYDVLSATWSSLRPVSTIDAGDVIYTWTNKTTAIFWYVYPYGGDEDFEKLVMAVTECQGSVGCLVKVDSWSENGEGISLPVPKIKSEVREFSISPINAATSFGLPQACYLYANNLAAAEPYYDFVEKIVISGPESNREVAIYPVCPRFPSGLEWD